MRIEPAPLPMGAANVSTVPFEVCQRLLREVLAHRGCLEVSGLGGTGKTHAVDYFFAHSDRDVVKIHLENRVKGYTFLRRVVALLGGDAKGDGPALMAELRELCKGRRVYIYVDEADLLNMDSLRQIRYLRDQRDLHIAWVLVGSDFRKAYRLVPELWSRVTRRVSFDPMIGAGLLVTLAAFHPFLADADPALLLRIDAEHCQGNWRVWSVTLNTLLDYAKRMGLTTLTEDLAAAALGVSVDHHRATPGLAAIRAQRPRKAA